MSRPGEGPSGGLSVTGLEVELGGRVVLSGVDLRVPPGTTAAVVGGDGAGKTTLLRTLAGSLAPRAGTVSRPEPTAALLGTGLFADLTVTENLAFTAAAHGLEGWRPRTDELLEAAGLESARDRLGGALSGGMARKLATVLALLAEPALLLLDEPTTGVDPVSRLQLWQLFGRAAEQGAAVVVATTYLQEAGRAGQVLVLEDGEVLATGTPEDVVAAMPGRLGRTDEPPPGARAWRRGRDWMVHSPDGRLPSGSEPVAPDLEAAVIVAQLEAASADSAAAGVEHDGSAEPKPASKPELRSEDGPAPPPTTVEGGRVLSARGLVRAFGDTVAVDEVDLEVAAGEVVGLVGANGAGKTTLIRLLLGLLRPDAGGVELLGGPPSRAGLERVGYVPQTLGLWRDLTVAANLALRRAVYGHAGQLPAAVARDAATVVADLPMGHRRRVAFTLALDHAPSVLVLDEPTSGVDPLSRARLWDTIRAAADRGVGVLVSTHYLDEAAQCDRIVLLAGGRVAASGPPDQLAEDGESTTAALERLLGARTTPAGR